jgi:hypothetical protein
MMAGDLEGLRMEIAMQAIVQVHSNGGIAPIKNAVREYDEMWLLYEELERQIESQRMRYVDSEPAPKLTRLADYNSRGLMEKKTT